MGLSLGFTQISCNNDHQYCQICNEWKELFMVAHLCGVPLVQGLWYGCQTKTTGKQHIGVSDMCFRMLPLGCRFARKKEWDSWHLVNPLTCLTSEVKRHVAPLRESESLPPLNPACSNSSLYPGHGAGITVCQHEKERTCLCGECCVLCTVCVLCVLCAVVCGGFRF